MLAAQTSRRKVATMRSSATGWLGLWFFRCFRDVLSTGRGTSFGMGDSEQLLRSLCQRRFRQRLTLIMHKSACADPNQPECKVMICWGGVRSRRFSFGCLWATRVRHVWALLWTHEHMTPEGGSGDCQSRDTAQNRCSMCLSLPPQRSR